MNVLYKFKKIMKKYYAFLAVIEKDYDKTVTLFASAYICVE